MKLRRVLRAAWPTVVYLLLIPPSALLAISDGTTAADVVVSSIAYLGFAVVGGLISYKSRNRIGAVFSALSLTAAVAYSSQSYMQHSLLHDPGSLPGAVAAAWVNYVAFFPMFLLSFAVPFLLFPTGSASSPRWKAVVWAVWAWIAVSALSSAIVPTLDFGDVSLANPLAVESLAWASEPLLELGFPLMMVFGLLAVVSLIFRYRGSDREQRAQIKWFLLAGSFLVTSLILDEFVLDVLSVNSSWIENTIETASLTIGLLGLPIATGIAITKYRLYDIDVVINRALVYGSLTTILAAAYFSIVVVLQRLVPGAGDSQITVAGSTLAVAALFRPLRTRIQSFIDRRFYRAKYDAAKTLEKFGLRLRDEIDIDELSADLLGVARDAMHPKHASLWIRSTGETA